jgi:hypothetical protein
MRITVSRRQNLTFIPEGQDDVPEGERLALTLRPMSLAIEEEMMDGVLDRQAKGEQYAGDMRLFNRVFRTHVIGFKNVRYDDGAEIPYDSAWAKDGLPEEIVAGFDVKIRTSTFMHLIAQAGMKGEAEVGKSESPHT